MAPRIVLSILIALALGACTEQEPHVLVSFTPAHPAATIAEWNGDRESTGPLGSYMRVGAWAWGSDAPIDSWIEAGAWGWDAIGVGLISNDAADEDLPACGPNPHCGPARCRLDVVVTIADFPGGAWGWAVPGYWGPQGDISWVFVDPRVPTGTDRLSVMAHELGHVLGIEHLPNESLSLMSSVNRGYSEAQSDDVAAAMALCEGF